MKIPDIADIVDKLLPGVRGPKTEYGKIVAERQKIDAADDEIRKADPNREEYHRDAAALVDKIRAGFAAKRAAEIVQTAARRIIPGPDGGHIVTEPGLADCLTVFWTGTFENLFGVLPRDVGVAFLMAMFDAAVRTPGLPIAERLAVLEANLTRRAKLDADQTLLSDAMGAEGIKIPLPDSEVARRAAAGRQLEAAKHKAFEKKMDDLTYGQFRPSEPK